MGKILTIVLVGLFILIILSCLKKNKDKNKVLFVRDGYWNDFVLGYPYYFIFHRSKCKEFGMAKYLDYKNLNNITLDDCCFDFYKIEQEYHNLGTFVYKNILQNKSSSKNKKFIFSQKNDLISIEFSDMDTKNVFKSKKESILKKQIEHLEEQLELFKNEFNISNILQHCYIYSRTPYSTHVTTFEAIKPNIVLEHLDSNLITQCFKKCIEFKFCKYLQYIEFRIEEIKKEYEGEMYGRLGEEAVINTTNEFDNCIALHNIQLPTSNSKGEEFITEIDTILVTTRGVFVLEVKNYGKVGSYEIKIDSTGQWVTYYPLEGKEVPRENPNRQNNMHVISFNRFINNKLKDKDIDAIGVIVIGNDDVKITQESPMKNLKRVDELYNYIKEFEPNKYTLDEVREIAKIINENKVVIDKKYKINCLYEEVLINLEVIREDMNKIIKLPHDKESVEQFLKENQKKYKYSFVETLGIDNRDYYFQRESNHVEGYIFSEDVIDKGKLNK